MTSRGLMPEHMAAVAGFIDRGVAEAAKGDGEVSAEFATRLRAEVAEFLEAFPAPGL